MKKGKRYDASPDREQFTDATATPSATDTQRAERLRKAAGKIKPRMTPAELVKFDDLLTTVSEYLEFGCGGSTAIAALRPIEHIWSVESDSAWVDKCKRHPAIGARIEANTIAFRHADIGPTKRWGFPASKDFADRWPAYYLAIWNDLDPKKLDFIFVDGRWRVECVLQALLRVRNDCLIAMHDFSAKRKEYNAVLEFVDVLDHTDTLLTFRRKADVNWSRLREEIPRYERRPK